jgi:peptidoglycan L-alanyl-D-glutamate endopeptidase CwlK
MNWYKEVIVKSDVFKSPKWCGEEQICLLYPPFREKVIQVKQELAKQKLPFYIYETFRSNARQLELYKKGYSKVKTAGMHTYGVAVDFVGKDNKGNWSWDMKLPWSKLGAISKKLGLFWGGDWTSFKDYPHIQMIRANAIEQNKIRLGVYPKWVEDI